MAQTIVRQTIIKLEFADLEKVSDGITEHYEYDGTPINELSDKQWEEIRNSDIMKTYIKVFNEIAQVVKDVWQTVAEEVAVLANSIVDYQKQLEAEIERVNRQKAKEDDKKD